MEQKVLHQTEFLNLALFDFETDSTASFVHGVAGLQDSNMHKIDAILKQLNQKITELENRVAVLEAK